MMAPPFLQSPPAKTSFSALLVLLIGMAAFYAPASINGEPQPTLLPLYSTILSLILLTCLALGRTLWNNVLMAGTLLAMLGIFTLLSPMENFAFGAIFPYVSICCVLSRDLRGLALERPKQALLLLCLPILILGWSTIIGIEAVVALQEKWYQFNTELFERMISWFAKPVTVFGTHSVAAFAYFALCLLFLRMATLATSKTNRGFAYTLFFGFAFLMPWLLSVSSFLLFSLLLCIFMLRVVKALDWRLNVMLGLLLLFYAIYLASSGFFQENEMMKSAWDALNDKGNGFSGRVGSESRLEPTYTYLWRNYFQPLGISYDGIVEFGDNFIAEYVMRTSIFGYALIMAMLFNFLRTNLGSMRECLFFFIFFLCADIGYPLLSAYRILFVLPLYVVLWNSVRPAEASADMSAVTL
ncbi:hypothetical protein AAKU55_000786 [Oxalobacteraceae bacterium GrIS 1.11]